MKILYLLFSLIFLALQVSPGLSLPQREMLFCKRGTCHFRGCPFHLVEAGRCFGLFYCCKPPWDIRNVDEPYIEEQ